MTRDLPPGSGVLYTPHPAGEPTGWLRCSSTHRAYDCVPRDFGDASRCGDEPCRGVVVEIVPASADLHANVAALARELAGRKPALHGAARHERTAGPARRQTVHPKVEGSEVAGARLLEVPEGKPSAAGAAGVDVSLG
jgi:hypothetical protein